jgi:hypothetical protein
MHERIISTYGTASRFAARDRAWTYEPLVPTTEKRAARARSLSRRGPDRNHRQVYGRVAERRLAHGLLTFDQLAAELVGLNRSSTGTASIRPSRR